MATKNTLKNWFKQGMKPLENQFAEWIDSFWHKDDKIPVNSVVDLTQILNAKAEAAELDAHKTDTNAHDDIRGELSTKIDYSDIINELDSNETQKPLSAAMGKELNVKVDAANGSGGFIAPYDFGTDIPTQQAFTDYAMNYIFGLDALNHSQLELFNGTKVQNLFDKRVWQLANTPNTMPPIFSWEMALIVSEAQRNFTADPIKTNEISDNSVTDAKLGNRTLTDAAAANTLPATGTLTSILQTVRNCLKWLVELFNTSTGHDHNGTNSKKVSYNDLNDTPSIPAAPGTLNTDNTLPIPILPSAEPLSGNINLHRIAKTGKYSDLSGAPIVNNSIIIFKQGGIIKGSITLNQTDNKTIDLDAGGVGGNVTINGNALPALRLYKKDNAYGVQLVGLFDTDLIDYLNGNAFLCLLRIKKRKDPITNAMNVRWGIWYDKEVETSASPFLGYNNNFYFHSPMGMGDRFCDLQYRIKPVPANFDSDGLMFSQLTNQMALVRRLFVFFTEAGPTNEYILLDPFTITTKSGLYIKSSLLGHNKINIADITADKPFVCVRFGLALAVRVGGKFIVGDILKIKLNFKVEPDYNPLLQGISNVKLSEVMNTRFKRNV